MKKIRVMHLIHELCLGGAQNGIINLVNYHDPVQFDTSICCLVSNGVLTERIDRSKTDVFELGKRPGNDFTLPFRVFNTLRRWRPHIVHTHSWGTLCEGILGAKLARVPVIIHGEHGTIQTKPGNIAVQRFFWKMADQVLSVSGMHKKRLAETINFPEEKIEVIINGVDTNRFSKAARNYELREKLGAEKSDIIIGSAGRLNPVKNYPLLIRAFSKLSEKESNIRLLFAGDGESDGELKNLAKSLGISSRTVFLGRRSDIPEIMQSMDIFVLPSFSEGMSNTILEAMSTGLPVVATSVGGNTELVKHNVTGLLVPSDDLDAMTGALHDLVRNTRKRSDMGVEAKVEIERRFSIHSMVSNYEAIYKRMISGKELL